MFLDETEPFGVGFAPLVGGKMLLFGGILVMPPMRGKMPHFGGKETRFWKSMPPVGSKMPLFCGIAGDAAHGRQVIVSWTAKCRIDGKPGFVIRYNTVRWSL